jgi:hypothetical protein
VIRALGVYRENEFSPGKVGADAAILDAVLARLAAEGVHASAMAAAEFIREPASDCGLVLAMCQSEAALARLRACHQLGALVINSPAAIRACYRDRLGEALSRAGAPIPPGMLVATAAGLDGCTIGSLDPRSGIYVKRGDLHALFAGDVQRVNDRASLERVLRDFAERGIRHAYLQAAVEGRVVKFYGVTGAGFFSTAGEGVDDLLAARLRDAAQDAAGALGLEVWGGDAIVDGPRFKIVDFNDWPSFERVRDHAARAIAKRALQLLRRGN